MNRILRVKNSNYTTISNVFIRDVHLSLKAKGLLALVMSLPETWDFSVSGIVAITKEGKTALYSAISELKEFGYCSVKTLRDERGCVTGNEYTFYEEPHNEKPHNEEPHPQNLNVDSKPQINKEGNNYIEDYYPTVNNKDLKEEEKEIYKEKDAKQENGSGGQSEQDLSFVDSSFLPVVIDWLTYKKERKERYKSTRALKMFYSRLKRLSGGDPQIAREIVEQSMANNYMGIFELKKPYTNAGQLPHGMILTGDRDLAIREGKKDLW